MKKEAEQNKEHRVVRGGGWNHPLDLVQVFLRGRYEQVGREDELGFRLVRHRSALERLLEVWNEPIRIES
jgi:formylglycine-generating enzyme required for sulfatase activity